MSTSARTYNCVWFFFCTNDWSSLLSTDSRKIPVRLQTQGTPLKKSRGQQQHTKKKTYLCDFEHKEHLQNHEGNTTPKKHTPKKHKKTTVWEGTNKSLKQWKDRTIQWVKQQQFFFEKSEEKERCPKGPKQKTKQKIGTVPFVWYYVLFRIARIANPARTGGPNNNTAQAQTYINKQARCGLVGQDTKNNCRYVVAWHETTINCAAKLNKNDGTTLARRVTRSLWKHSPTIPRSILVYPYSSASSGNRDQPSTVGSPTHTTVTHETETVR